MRQLWAIAIAVLLWAPGCHKRMADAFHGDDALMFNGAQEIAAAINAYHQDTAEWPEVMRSAEPYLVPGSPWPVNPYTNQPIEDTGSPEFDPDTSAGMVYYEKYVRDDVIVNYRLHVFGRKGKLTIIGNSAFGAE